MLTLGNANYAWVQHFLHHVAPTDIKIIKWATNDVTRLFGCILSITKT